MSHPYVMPPPPGYTEVLPGALRRLHASAAEMNGCGVDADHPHNWRHCEAFALARLRGMGRNVYVIQTADSYAYRLVVEWTDGPAGAQGLQIGEAIEGWAPAILAAVANLAEDGEFTDTLSPGQADTLTALTAQEA